MTLAEIRAMPTTVSYGPNAPRVHESCLRSFQTVQKVKSLLAAEVPHATILEIVSDLMGGPQTDYEAGQR